MHRTHWGGLLAVNIPTALSVHWGLALPLAVALFNTRCFTAWLAAVIGVAMLWPASLWLTIPAASVLALACWQHYWIDRWLPYGASLDGLRARLISWAYLLRTWSWRGGDVRLALEAAHIRSGGRAMEGAPARNEFAQFAYRYGLLGVAALAACIALLVPWLRIGDPLSATLVTAGVLVSGTSPLLALRRWLAGGDEPLFGPSLKASLTVHIDDQLRAHLYGVATVDRDTALAVARAFYNLGRAWSMTHGLSVEEVAGHESPR